MSAQLRKFSMLLIVSAVWLVGCATTKVDWKRAHKLGTLEAYQEFLQKYPASELANNAKREIEKLEWQKTRQQGAQEPYYVFLRKYPKSEFADDAERELEKLNWEEARQQGTQESFRLFLQRHPRGKFAGDAEKKLEKLDWKEARQFGTQEAYYEFLQRHPASSLITEIASSKLEELVDKYPGEMERIIPMIETSIMQEIANKGTKARFVINEIELGAGLQGRLTISAVDSANKILQFNCEFDGDRIPIINNEPRIPWANCSVHRYEGEVRINFDSDLFTFFGEGDKLHRLSFCVIENIGYVYLRGRGRVLLKNEKEVKLGY